MAGVEGAKSIKELSDVALVLFNQSLQAYHEISLSTTEMLTGARPFSSEEAAKNATKAAGVMARDAGNLMMVWTQLSKIAAPTVAAAATGATGATEQAAQAAGKGTAKKATAKKGAAKKATAKKATAKKAPAKKAAS